MTQFRRPTAWITYWLVLWTEASGNDSKLHMIFMK